jgi:predicted Holliday junction resolvase-like endonuclease
MTVHLEYNLNQLEMKKSDIQTVLANVIIKLTDIQEEFLCRIEAEKIRNEVEEAFRKLRKGLISQSQFLMIISKNQEKLEDTLLGNA